MSRCLSERGLLEIAGGDGRAAQLHLRACADCAERYEALAEDLEAIDGVLAQPPPAPPLTSTVPAVVMRWLPATAAVAMLLVIGVAVTWLLAPAPELTAARRRNLRAFAADVSAAVFTGGDTSGIRQVTAEAPYLQAALGAGLPCTQDRYFTGECNDQVGALVFAGD